MSKPVQRPFAKVSAVADDPGRLPRPALQSLALTLAVILITMTTIVKPAYALGTVAPAAPLWCSNPDFSSTCIYSTKEAACVAQIGNRTDYYYGFVYYYPGGEAVGWTCWAYAALYPGNAAYAQRFGWFGTKAVCPANSTGTTTCTCNSGYQPDPTATSCVPVLACPAHASGTPCVCDAGYEFDSTKTSCVPDVVCPIDPLPKPPFPGDINTACTASLEKGAGKDVDHKCPDLTRDMVKGASCLSDKIHALAIPYTEPSGTVRTEVYQKHLVDVWKKWKEIEELKTDAEKQACAATITDVTNEKKWHGIDSPPSKKKGDAPHVLRRAIDIPRAVVNALIAKVPTTSTVSMLPGCLSCSMTIPYDVEDYVNSATVNPPACNLSWGGRFSAVDPVHFQLP